MLLVLALILLLVLLVALLLLLTGLLLLVSLWEAEVEVEQVLQERGDLRRMHAALGGGLVPAMKISSITSPAGQWVSASSPDCLHILTPVTMPPGIGEIPRGRSASACFIYAAQI